MAVVSLGLGKTWLGEEQGTGAYHCAVWTKPRQASGGRACGLVLDFEKLFCKETGDRRRAVA